jgi:hypothetical protein
MSATRFAWHIISKVFKIFTRSIKIFDIFITDWLNFQSAFIKYSKRIVDQVTFFLNVSSEMKILKSKSGQNLAFTFQDTYKSPHQKNES